MQGSKFNRKINRRGFLQKNSRPSIKANRSSPGSTHSILTERREKTGGAGDQIPPARVFPLRPDPACPDHPGRSGWYGGVGRIRRFITHPKVRPYRLPGPQRHVSPSSSPSPSPLTSPPAHDLPQRPSNPRRRFEIRIRRLQELASIQREP